MTKGVLPGPKEVKVTEGIRGTTEVSVILSSGLEANLTIQYIHTSYFTKSSV